MKRINFVDRNSTLSLCLFIIDTCLLCAAAVKHTFWRDETQAWLIARDSPNFVALLHNLRYEGHPPLWHIVLFPLTRLGLDPRWMELPHLLFAIAAGALLLFSKQLTLPTRAGLTFSYFLLFEYGTITRNYMLGIVLLLAATILMTRKDNRTTWTVPVLLSLAALSSLPALVLAVSVFNIYLVQNCLLHRDGVNGIQLRTPRTPFMLSSVLFVMCAFASAVLIRPPSDTGVFLEFHPLPQGLTAKLSRCGSTIAAAYVPIPLWAHEFWDVAYVRTLSHHLSEIFGWALFAAIVLYFRRPVARYFFLAGSALLLVEELLSRRFSMRNVGWLFICFILALLLEYAPSGLQRSKTQVRSWWRTCLMAAVLTGQVYSGLFAVAVSLKYPFSRSLEAANFLRSQHLDSAPLVFEPDFVGSPILAYLQLPSAYSFELHRQTSFVLWSRTEFLERHVPSPAELKMAAGSRVHPVLITVKALSPEQENSLHVHRLATFDHAINPFDNYYIYR
jgi:hypothetical protein